jgi:hypothetical protein
MAHRILSVKLIPAMQEIFHKNEIFSLLFLITLLYKMTFAHFGRCRSEIYPPLFRTTRKDMQEEFVVEQARLLRCVTGDSGIPITAAHDSQERVI